MANTKGTSFSVHQILTATNCLLLLASTSLLTYKVYKLDTTLADKLSEEDQVKLSLNTMRNNHKDLVKRVMILEKVPNTISKDHKDGKQAVRQRRGLKSSGSIQPAALKKAIHALVKPRFVQVQSSVSAREGENVTVSCKVTGYPAPRIKWIKENKAIANNRYVVNGTDLTVLRVVFEDQGVFGCLAKNVFDKAVTSVQLIVRGPVRLTKAPPAYQIGYRNKTTFLPCKAVGNPAPTVTWTRSPPKPLQKRRQKQTKEGLEIDRTSSLDAGHYVCMAFNALGSKIRVTSLTIKNVVSPTFTVRPRSPQNVTRVGDPVRITCEARGDPRPTVKWYFNNKALLNVNTNSRGDNKEASELFIKSFQPKDAGMYNCIASNVYGNSVERRVTLDLVSCGNPGVPRNGFKIGDRYRVGDVVFFACNSWCNPEGSQVSMCLSSGVWFPKDLPVCVLKGWFKPAQFGTWSDFRRTFEGNLPGNSDAVYHYGPTRVWSKPIHSSHYEITSKLLMKNGNGCGHIFKYKKDSRRSQSLVTEAWGYFPWSNSYLYISSNGQESAPRINYYFKSNAWLDLKTVVRGTNVKIYINNKFVHQLTIGGKGSSSTTNNYVGLWCHRLAHVMGRDFKVVPQ